MYSIFFNEIHYYLIIISIMLHALRPATILELSLKVVKCNYYSRDRIRRISSDSSGVAAPVHKKHNRHVSYFAASYIVYQRA